MNIGDKTDTGIIIFDNGVTVTDDKGTWRYIEASLIDLDEGVARQQGAVGVSRYIDYVSYIEHLNTQNTFLDKPSNWRLPNCTESFYLKNLSNIDCRFYVTSSPSGYDLILVYNPVTGASQNYKTVQYGCKARMIRNILE